MKSTNKSLYVFAIVLAVAMSIRPSTALAQNVLTSIYTGAPASGETVTGEDYSTGTSFVPTQFGFGTYQTTTADSQVDVSGSNLASGIGSYGFNAYTTYGSNHAAATFGPTTEGYFNGSATSEYTDTFIASPSATSTFGSPMYAQFTFTIDGSISGSALSTFSFSTFSTSPNSFFFPSSPGSATEVGTLTTNYDSYTTNTLFGKQSTDSVSISDPQSYSSATTNETLDTGTVTLVTQYFELSSAGSLTATADLFSQVNPEELGYVPPGDTIQGSANFGQTAALTGISFFTSNGTLIPTGDVNLSSASGATYPVGLKPAPESTTFVSLALGIGVLFLLVAQRKKHEKLGKFTG